MGKKAKAIVLNAKERKQLLSLTRAGTTERRLAERANMILAAAEGRMTAQIAAAMNTCPARVSKWRTRFALEGVEGLKDASRIGAPPRYGHKTERRILAVLDESPPEGFVT